jgi:hypothetical protein
VVYIILGFFLRNSLVQSILSLVPVAALLYMAIFSENIYFELEEDGILRYYKGKVLQKTFDIKQCHVGYFRKSDRSFPPSHDIRLKIFDPSQGEEEINIDCSPLGVNSFDEMYRTLDGLSANEPEELSAEPAETKV